MPWLVLAVLPLLCLAQGCERVSQRKLKTKLLMGDSATAAQLVSGFYGVEGNSWRWTARRFVIIFPGSQGRARFHNLKLDLFVPDGQIEQLGPLTLTANVDGIDLPAETFRESGVHTYLRMVPETAVRSNIVPVTFSLDKAVPPVSSDGRELGLVVNSAQLNAN